MDFIFPSSQGELLRQVRGERSQAEFAALLGVERSCLSRYENEKIGAPVAVLNYCLAQVARVATRAPEGSAVEQALVLLQRATKSLSQARQVSAKRQPVKRRE